MAGFPIVESALESIRETIRRLAETGDGTGGAPCCKAPWLCTVFVLSVLLLLVVLILGGTWWFSGSANNRGQPGGEVLPIDRG